MPLSIRCYVASGAVSRLHAEQVKQEGGQVIIRPAADSDERPLSGVTVDMANVAMRCQFNARFENSQDLGWFAVTWEQIEKLEALQSR